MSVISCTQEYCIQGSAIVHNYKPKTLITSVDGVTLDYWIPLICIVVFSRIHIHKLPGQSVTPKSALPTYMFLYSVNCSPGYCYMARHSQATVP